VNSRSGEADDPQIRAMGAPDAEAVLALLRTVMGWPPDQRVDDFFEWKHQLNPFGRSAGWVGCDDDGNIVAVRLLMRWRFVRDGVPVDAVRAVDTATHPSQQGRGWFTRLTMTAVSQLTSDGVGFVFNTPNDRSWPGYQKMGWVEATRPAVQVRPASLLKALRLGGARVAAEKWADPVGNAPRAGALLEAHRDPIERLLSERQREAFETDRSTSYLNWRYGLKSLGYQALALSRDPAEGIVIYRVRRRGSAVEASICELLVPAGQLGARRQLVKLALRDSGADFALAGGEPSRSGLVTVPKLGPRLTLRTLAETPSSPSMRLGDLELF